MEHILAWQPDVIVLFHARPASEENQRTANLVHTYTQRCRLWFTAETHEIYASHMIDAYGDCDKGGAAGGVSSTGGATGR